MRSVLLSLKPRTSTWVPKRIRLVRASLFFVSSPFGTPFPLAGTQVVWNIRATMKPIHVLLLASSLGALLAPATLQAQLLGGGGGMKAPRSYMNRIAPLLPPAGGSNTNAAAPANARPVPPPIIIQAPPPPPPDPEKEKAKNEEVLKHTIEFQKMRAENGSETAQYDLGMRYMNGDGLDKDPVLARKWLSASAKQGNTSAAKKLAELNQTEKADAKEAPAKEAAPKPRADATSK